MTDDKQVAAMRKAFEAHLRETFPAVADETFSKCLHGTYKSKLAEYVWLAWQAATAQATAAQPVQPASPQGWRLVPIEPTEAMMKAGGHVNSEWLNDNAPIGESRYARAMPGVYGAMLKAAPAHSSK